MSATSQPAQHPLDPRTLDNVIALIGTRLRELDRLGPPTAPGYGCAVCHDAELHRLLAVLKRQRA